MGVSEDFYEKKLIDAFYTVVARILNAKDDSEEDLFAAVKDCLGDGIMAKDPLMLYLAARYSRSTNKYYFWTDHPIEGIELGFLNDGTDWDAIDDMLLAMGYDQAFVDHWDLHECPCYSANEMFDMAIQEGSILALLWCAYCYDTLPDMYPNYQKYLSLAKKLPPEKIPETVVLRKFDFLRTEIERINHETHDVNVLEDLLGSEIAFGEVDSGKVEYPDPGWYVLKERCEKLAEFAYFDLGLDPIDAEGKFAVPYSNKYEFQDWMEDYDILHARIEDWEEWCKSSLTGKEK